MGEKTRVLVVDDDRSMVKTICDILKVKGLEATEAYSGEEAVEKVRSDNPDCVLMDMKMPGINGIETLLMMKEISPRLPVVLISAYTTEAMEADAKKNGAYAVLTKPVDIQMVLLFLSHIRKEGSILIVDDDPGFCKTLKDIFQLRGYRVATEIDPAKVLGHMENDYKLTVVLDLKLGNANGLDVLREIRAKYPSKPVVLVTGYGEEMADSIEKGYRIGAYTCLYKPIEVESLITTVEEIQRNKLGAVLGEPFDTRRRGV
ncbi:MAG: response regulator [Desulfuromonadaceae bacterium]|nr:response regulator [Desulfuromonadaceae bacterium]MDD5105228.1 response regulator [Desulfuromonadaceae bacterium]